MPSAEIRSALINLRKCARLDKQIDEAQRKLIKLHSDQFQFSDADFAEAQAIFAAEQAKKPRE